MTCRKDRETFMGEAGTGNRIIKNGIFNILKTASTILFPLMTIPYISRILRADDIGKINFSRSVVNYFSLIASLGVHTYAIRTCSKARGSREELGRTASQIFSINLCTMILSYGMLFALLVFSSKLRPYDRLIMIFSLSICFQILGADWLNMAMEDFKYISVRTFITQLLSFVCLLMFVKQEEDFIRYAFIIALSSCGANMMNMFYRKKFCRIRFTADMKPGLHMKPIFLLFSLLLAQSVLSNLDITMLGLFKSEAEVGYYSMTVHIYTTVEMIISSVAFVLIPQLSCYFDTGNETKINGLLHSALNFIIVFGLPFFTGLFLLSGEILTIVCGEAYAAAAPGLSMLAVAMMINLLGGGFWGNLILLPSGRDGQFMAACLVSAIFNAAANYIFIPKYGMGGAAFTTVLSVTIIMMLCMAKPDKRIHIDYKMKELASPGTGAVLIALICLICKKMIAGVILRVTLCVILGAITYTASIFAGRNELAVIVEKRWLRRRPPE